MDENFCQRLYMYTLILLSRQKWRERANSKKTTKRSKEKFGSFFFSASPVLKPHPNSSSNNQGNSFFTCLIFIFIVFVMNLGHTQINDDCRDNRHQKQNKKQLLALHGFLKGVITQVAHLVSKLVGKTRKNA